MKVFSLGHLFGVFSSKEVEADCYLRSQDLLRISVGFACCIQVINGSRAHQWLKMFSRERLRRVRPGESADAVLARAGFVV